MMNLAEWLEHTIIGLELCPFALRPWREKKIRTFESEAQSPFEAQEALALELEKLHLTPAVSTTLLGFPDWEIDFLSFLDFFYDMEELLEELDLAGEFQLVCFHPEFLMDGFPVDSFAHWANSSPMPVIHLLRREEFNHALQLPDARAISERNEELISHLDEAHRRKKFPWKLSP
jgi:hypothetical protein